MRFVFKFKTRARQLLFIGTVVYLVAFGFGSSGSMPTARAQEPNYKKIIESYLFVDDFNIKPPERQVSEELFWRYVLKLPNPEFALIYKIAADQREMPQAPGSGPEYFHINRGRIHYLNGDFEKARKVWLSGRARFGDKWPLHRRLDYYIALAFMALAQEKINKVGPLWNDVDIKTYLGNASTFLSGALIVKAADSDPVVDEMAPKQFYNLAAIYFNYGRFAGAYGAASKGLEYLRQKGRSEYRPELQHIIAETHIQNHSYLEAAQIYDAALREDPSPEFAATIFSRIADIYLDLNNYDLAEHNYKLSQLVDRDLDRMSPKQFVLRGEALFWTGRFEEAQKTLGFALDMESSLQSSAPLDDHYASFANLRLGDALLAAGDLKKAKITYGRISHEFPNFEAGQIARIRSACLELPDYGPEKNDFNVKHARDLLVASKNSALPEPARELAWACHVLSYTERQRTPEMIERVREFYESFPYARHFLKKMVEPVREYQASKIDKYFEEKDDYGAAQFFEVNRKNLFPKIEDKLASNLFISFMNIHRAEAAKEFLEPYERLADDDHWKFIRIIALLGETYSKNHHQKYHRRSERLANSMRKLSPELKARPRLISYLQRIKATPLAQQHLGWIFEIERKWSEQDPKYVCLGAFPTLSRWYQGSQEPKIKEVRATVRSFVADHLSSTMKDDPHCALSLLELEFDALRSDLDTLVKTYDARKEWPLRAEIVDIFWAVGEHLLINQRTQEAEDIFKHIAAKAPQDHIKVKFSKMRLDKTRTEFEDIWR